MTAQAYPGWMLVRDDDEGPEARLPRQRWRMLHDTRPHMAPTGPMPRWIETPDDFVYWLAAYLTATELHAYFRDLEAAARRSCDLELLRFARRYRHSHVAYEFEDVREQM